MLNQYIFSICESTCCDFVVMLILNQRLTSVHISIYFYVVTLILDVIFMLKLWHWINVWCAFTMRCHFFMLKCWYGINVWSVYIFQWSFALKSLNIIDVYPAFTVLYNFDVEKNENDSVYKTRLQPNKNIAKHSIYRTRPSPKQCLTNHGPVSI